MCVSRPYPQPLPNPTISQNSNLLQPSSHTRVNKIKGFFWTKSKIPFQARFVWGKNWKLAENSMLRPKKTSLKISFDNLLNLTKSLVSSSWIQLTPIFTRIMVKNSQYLAYFRHTRNKIKLKQKNSVYPYLTEVSSNSKQKG